MSITGFNRRRREQAAQTPEPVQPASTPAPKRRRKPKPAEQDTTTEE